MANSLLRAGCCRKLYRVSYCQGHTECGSCGSLDPHYVDLSFTPPVICPGCITDGTRYSARQLTFVCPSFAGIRIAPCPTQNDAFATKIHDSTSTVRRWYSTSQNCIDGTVANYSYGPYRRIVVDVHGSGFNYLGAAIQIPRIGGGYPLYVWSCSHQTLVPAGDCLMRHTAVPNYKAVCDLDGYYQQLRMGGGTMDISPVQSPLWNKKVMIPLKIGNQFSDINSTPNVRFAYGGFAYRVVEGPLNGSPDVATDFGLYKGPYTTENEAYDAAGILHE